MPGAGDASYERQPPVRPYSAPARPGGDGGRSSGRLPVPRSTQNSATPPRERARLSRGERLAEELARAPQSPPRQSASGRRASSGGGGDSRDAFENPREFFLSGGSNTALPPPASKRRADGSNGSGGAAHLSPALASAPHKRRLGGAGWHDAADDPLSPPLHRGAGARRGGSSGTNTVSGAPAGGIRSTAEEWAEWEQIRTSLGDGRSEALARAAASYASLTRIQRLRLFLVGVARRAWYLFDAQLTHFGFLIFLMVFTAFVVTATGGRLLQLQAERSKDEEMLELPHNFTARACASFVCLQA
jgi:hypothetical protein